MAADDLEQWLLSLPLEEPCNIDGENVYLRLGPDGAELGVILMTNPSAAQVAEALRTGFQGALEYEAGLALAAAGDELVINRWIDDVEAWSDVGEALEGILNQAALFRAAMAHSEDHAGVARRPDTRARQELNRGL